MKNRGLLLLSASVGLLTVALSSAVRTQSRARTSTQAQYMGLAVVAGEALVRPRSAAALPQIDSDMDADDDQPVGQGGWRRIHSASRSVDVLVTALRSRADVLEVEPNYIVHTTATIPNDPMFPSMWDLLNMANPGADIHATSAWDVSRGSTANVVGMVDTGIDYTHGDLAGNMWTAPKAFAITIQGTSFTCPAGSHGFNAIKFAANDLVGACDPMDDNGHGTHTAGTVGAIGNNALGVTGVNWTASLMAMKFLDSTGSGAVSDAVNAIDFAIQTKAAFATGSLANVRVLSNSWGGPGYSSALQSAIERAAAADMLFVDAAGNSSSNDDSTPFYPASLSEFEANMITVAATDPNDLLASFSNYGSKTVQLGAPGVNIVSTWPSNQYATDSGTSMATPHVAGAAALLLSVCNLTTSQLKTAILNNIDLVTSLTPPTTVTGGRLDADKAIRSCVGLPAVTLTSPTNGAVYTAPATVTLGATASGANGIAKVEFYQGTTLIGTSTTSPYGGTWSSVPAGTYAVTAKAYDTLGLTAVSAAATITVQPPSGTLPSPWVAQDVGSVGVAGSASYASGTFTVSGSGADIWGTADAFQYVDQPLSGDGQITAHVVSQSNTDPWAKAGVMIREDTSAGSRYAAVFVTPANGIAFEWRTAAGGGSTYAAATGTVPIWLRLARSGGTFTASTSSDGTTWTLVGTAILAMNSAAVTGLAVTSHNNSLLSNVTVESTAIAPLP